ncbi:MAG: N-acetyltransferase, partial [Candidatus Zixiibacteriota bacterium]
MSEVEVVEVESRGQKKQFIKYPYRLYKDDPNYVPPLLVERYEFFDKKRNPFYRGAKTRLFLAMRDGEVCGRIATCINYKHNQYHEERTGFFGFFDTPDDYEIASKLLKVAMITLKTDGMDRMRGPMNFSTNHEIGFLVEGFDSPPVVMMTYNRPYQPKFAERFGLKKVMDLLAYKISEENPISERVITLVEKLRRRGNITIRKINMKDFDNEVRRIREIYNAAWSMNWGFVPMDEAEFFYLAKDLKQIVDPDFVLIAEHEGKPVAFSLSLPNINQALIRLNGRLFPFGLLKLLWHTKIFSKINSVRIITMGVIPEYQKRGIDMMMYIETFTTGVGKGYWGEISWVLET